MHRKQIALCVLFTALGFGGGLAVGFLRTDQPQVVTMAAPGQGVAPGVSATQTPQTPQPTAVQKEEEEKYLLMLSGETICIYALLPDGKTELLQKTEVDTGQLRQEDYESLCRGMTIESLEKAKSLCEDFGS